MEELTRRSEEVWWKFDPDTFTGANPTLVVRQRASPPPQEPAAPVLIEVSRNPSSLCSNKPPSAPASGTDKQPEEVRWKSDPDTLTGANPTLVVKASHVSENGAQDGQMMTEVAPEKDVPASGSGGLAAETHGLEESRVLEVARQPSSFVNEMAFRDPVTAGEELAALIDDEFDDMTYKEDAVGALRWYASPEVSSVPQDAENKVMWVPPLPAVIDDIWWPNHQTDKNADRKHELMRQFADAVEFLRKLNRHCRKVDGKTEAEDEELLASAAEQLGKTIFRGVEAYKCRVNKEILDLLTRALTPKPDSNLIALSKILIRVLESTVWSSLNDDSKELAKQEFTKLIDGAASGKSDAQPLDFPKCPDLSRWFFGDLQSAEAEDFVAKNLIHKLFVRDEYKHEVVVHGDEFAKLKTALKALDENGKQDLFSLCKITTCMINLVGHEYKDLVRKTMFSLVKDCLPEEMSNSMWVSEQAIQTVFGTEMLPVKQTTFEGFSHRTTISFETPEKKYYRMEKVAVSSTAATKQLVDGNEVLVRKADLRNPGGAGLCVASSSGHYEVGAGEMDVVFATVVRPAGHDYLELQEQEVQAPGPARKLRFENPEQFPPHVHVSKLVDISHKHVNRPDELPLESGTFQIACLLANKY